MKELHQDHHHHAQEWPLTRLWRWMERWTGPDWIKLAIINSLSHLLAFWSLNYGLAKIAQYQWFQRYKLQKEVFKKTGLVRAAFKMNIGYDLVSSHLVAFLFEKILRGRFATARPSPAQNDKARKNDTALKNGGNTRHDATENDTDNNGWSGLTFQGPLPSTFTTVWQICVAYIGYDLMFYLSHRALHSKLLYQRFHKQHHEFVAPIGLSSSYQGTLEGITQMFNWYLPIGFAGWLNRKNGGLHGSTLFWYNVFRWVETVDAHCGYAFPFSPFHWIPLFGGAVAHDKHHSMVFVNYGASNVWDYLLGTSK